MNKQIEEVRADGMAEAAIPAQPGIDTVAIPLVSGEELLARAAQQVQPPPPPVKRWQDRYNHGVGSPAKIECMRLEIEDWRAVLATPAPVAGVQPFQQRVQPWMMACFGAEISADKKERNHRFFEESTELVQAQGMTASEAHQLVDYVYGRPVGEPAQEVGGVMVTLAALCLASGLDMHAAGETELARIWTKVEAIRAKQAAKPKHSPLPQAVQPAGGRDAALGFPLRDEDRKPLMDLAKTMRIRVGDAAVIILAAAEKGYINGINSIRAPATVTYQDEASKLARILFGLIEGGGANDGDDIYAAEYSAPDGDVYVHRAAELLIEQAAESKELTRYVEHFALAAHPANVAQVGDSSEAGITASVLEQAAQACDQQADGTNGPYRSACLACANAVRGLRDAAAKKG